MNKFLSLSVLAVALAMPVASFAEAKALELKDGTKIEVDGDNVSVVDKDGKKSPAPDGTHETKTGEKITTKGGKVAH